jgi:predicted AAA+ superfamily ATPase
MDPDNGLISKQRRHKDKFCFPNEAADFYNAGKNVVYYCSKGRRSDKAWKDYKNVMKDYLKEKSEKEKLSLPDAEIIAITYHKGTQRSYVFVLHPVSKEKYDKMLDAFSENWKGMFTREKE